MFRFVPGADQVVHLKQQEVVVALRATACSRVPQLMKKTPDPFEFLQAIQEADQYFNSIGVNENTPTNIPGNRH
jgi:hypothetical protein